MTHQEALVTAAKAEDTANLLNHIAWTDVVRPKLQEQVAIYSQLIVAEALGGKLPLGKSREQLAGICYGINYVSTLFEKILRDGERAMKDLADERITLQHLER
jgi:hypothetical protein